MFTINVWNVSFDFLFFQIKKLLCTWLDLSQQWLSKKRGKVPATFEKQRNKETLMRYLGFSTAFNPCKRKLNVLKQSQWWNLLEWILSIIQQGVNGGKRILYNSIWHWMKLNMNREGWNIHMHEHANGVWWIL